MQADDGNHIVRLVTLPVGSVQTLAGRVGVTGFADGSGTNAAFTNPRGIAVDAAWTFALVADQENHIIRRLSLPSGAVTTLVGLARNQGSTTGIGSIARFQRPCAVAMDAAGTFAIVGEFENNLIRRIDISSSTVTTIAGVPLAQGSSDGQGTAVRFFGIIGVAVDGAGTFALVVRAGPTSSQPRTLPLQLESFPSLVCLQADQLNRRVRHIALSTGTVTTLAGSSAGTTDGVVRATLLSRSYKRE